MSLESPPDSAPSSDLSGSCLAMGPGDTAITSTSADRARGPWVLSWIDTDMGTSLLGPAAFWAVPYRRRCRGPHLRAESKRVGACLSEEASFCQRCSHRTDANVDAEEAVSLRYGALR